MLRLALTVAICLQTSPVAGAAQVASAPARQQSEPRQTTAPHLTISNVGVERGPYIDLSPTTDLTFELTNGAATPYRDVVLEVSMVTGTLSTDRDAEPAVLAGPVAIRSTFELQPGFAMVYHVRLRNFSATCDCRPLVKVVSAVSVEKR